MAMPLSRRDLNRTLLERQLLLQRSSRSVPEVIEHLVGMQSQTPVSPYIALWARLADFRPQQLGELIESRQAVRIALQRSTIHLVSSADCLALRPVLQRVIERSLSANFRRGWKASIPGSWRRPAAHSWTRSRAPSPSSDRCSRSLAGSRPPGACDGGAGIGGIGPGAAAGGLGQVGCGQTHLRRSVARAPTRHGNRRRRSGAPIPPRVWAGVGQGHSGAGRD